MEIKEIRVKSVISKSGIYGIEYSINPYYGCGHGCRYCYARFVHVLRGGDPRDWGKFVHVKVNAPDIVREEMYRIKRGKILISSVVDPYQWIEQKYELTRRILKHLLKRNFPVVILTKSPLVIRDIDLITKFRDIEVGLTITTLRDDIKQAFEPNAPSIDSRLNALRELVNKRIKNYAFIAPIIPIMSLSDMGDLLEELKELGVDRVLVDKLNIKAKNWITIQDALNEYFPNKTAEFWRKVKNEDYWFLVKKFIIRKAKELNLNVDFCY